MNTATVDIPAVVGKWSSREKKRALAVLLRELADNGKSKPVVIEDEKKQTVGLFFPTDYTIEPLDLTENTPEMRELKRRAETRETAISHEEMKARLREVDIRQGRG